MRSKYVYNTFPKNNFLQKFLSYVRNFCTRISTKKFWDDMTFIYFPYLHFFLFCFQLIGFLSEIPLLEKKEFIILYDIEAYKKVFDSISNTVILGLPSISRKWSFQENTPTPGIYFLPKSISFSNMDEIEFHDLYGKLLNVACNLLDLDQQTIIEEIAEFY